MATKKPRLSKPLLKRHGIRYEETVYVDDGEHPLPIHLEIVREGLLDLEDFLIETVVKQFADMKKISEVKDIAQSAYTQIQLHESESRKLQAMEFLEMAYTLSVESTANDEEAEPTWQHTFNSTIFKRSIVFQKPKLFTTKSYHRYLLIRV